MADTLRLLTFDDSGDFEFVSTPAMLALHIPTGFALKAATAGWTAVWLVLALLLSLGFAWWGFWLSLGLAALGPYCQWNQRAGVTVTLSAEAFCIHYPSGACLQVPSRRILEFKHVPFCQAFYEAEESAGGFVEGLEVPTEALPTLSFGLLYNRDTNRVFGRGLDDSDLSVIAQVFNDWLFAMRETRSNFAP